MLTFVLEAAFRSLLMALAVWGAIRLLRVQAVVAQKLAWVLVLMAAATMPFVMRAPWLALDHAITIPRLPIASLPGMHWIATRLDTPAIDRRQGSRSQPVEVKVKIVQSPLIAKPSPAHLAPDEVSLETGKGSYQRPWLISVRDTTADLPESIALLSTTPTKANASAAFASVVKTVSPSQNLNSRFWNWARVRDLSVAL
jgi:hypothetical protein